MIVTVIVILRDRDRPATVGHAPETRPDQTRPDQRARDRQRQTPDIKRHCLTTQSKIEKNERRKRKKFVSLHGIGRDRAFWWWGRWWGFLRP